MMNFIDPWRGRGATQEGWTWSGFAKFATVSAVVIAVGIYVLHDVSATVATMPGGKEILIQSLPGLACIVLCCIWAALVLGSIHH